MSVSVINWPHEQLQRLQQTFFSLQPEEQLPGPARPGLALPFVACVSFLFAVCLYRQRRSEAMSGLDDDHFISFWW
jgi:hypothetical protein